MLARIRACSRKERLLVWELAAAASDWYALGHSWSRLGKSKKWRYSRASWSAAPTNLPEHANEAGNDVTMSTPQLLPTDQFVDRVRLKSGCGRSSLSPSKVVPVSVPGSGIGIGPTILVHCGCAEWITHNHSGLHNWEIRRQCPYATDDVANRD